MALPRRTATALSATLAALLALAAPALATTYTVAGTADDLQPQPCGAVSGGAATCGTLRAAILQADADGGSTVVVPAGTYVLAGALPVITADMTIAGDSAKTVVVQANPAFRPFAIEALVGTGAAAPTVTLHGMTIAGGAASSDSLPNGDGGNVYTSGSALTLDHVRVTGGTALRGGGVAVNGGTLQIVDSLIDGNSATRDANGGSGDGGGVLSTSTGALSTLTIADSTIAGNTAASSGGGIAVADNAKDGTTVTRTTIVGNVGTGGGIANEDGESFKLGATILSANTRVIRTTTQPSNCAGTVTSLGANVESADTCALTGPGDAVNSDPQLGPLADNGGQTATFALAATSPAIDVAGACTGTDQRDVTRPQGAACDAGAYEYVPPPPTPTPTATASPAPTATPPPATTATPTATPSPPPAALADRQIVLAPKSGTVLVELPGTTTYVRLETVKGVPPGSLIDARKGHVTLTSQPKPGAKPQTAEFWDGIFRVTQSGGVTVLKLTQPLSCPKPKKTARRAVAAAKPKAKKVKTRQLWGNGSGAFKTQGQYSSATVRGTEWLVRDTCTETLTRVKRGVVAVRDDVKRRTIVLRAGKRYVAKPKRTG